MYLVYFSFISLYILAKLARCIINGSIGRSSFWFTRQVRAANKMSTRTDVQVTDFTFPDVEGGSPSTPFFSMGKVRENRESALKLLKITGFRICTEFLLSWRVITQVSPFANVIRHENIVKHIFVYARFDLSHNFEKLERESNFYNKKHTFLNLFTINKSIQNCIDYFFYWSIHLNIKKKIFF